jgi:hypothetical protein
MAGYIGSKASVVSSGAERKKTFAITTSTTSLTGLSYTPTKAHVFHNGVRLVDGTDYTATNGTSITLNSAAENGDEVVVVSYATFQAADAYTKAEADAGFVNDPNGVITVDGSSNVGIGTTSPDDVLHVVTPSFGGITLECTGATADPVFTFLGDSGNSWTLHQDASQGDSFQFRYNNSEKIRIDSSGDLHVGGNVIAYSTTISDERLKTDIVKIDGALDKVAQLNGYTFTYTADGKKSAGVVAQEVQKVLPSAIVESTLPLKMGDDDETEYMTVQYDQLMGLMIEAIKELKAEVAELKGS